MNPLPPSANETKYAAEREGEHGDLARQLGGQLPPVGRDEQEAADCADPDSDDDGDRDLLERVGEVDALRAARRPSRAR